MRVFLKIIFVQLLLNLYVFWRGWQLLPKSNWWRIPFALIFGLEITAYFIGFAGVSSLPSNILRPIALLATSWMVFLVYTSALLLVYDVFRYGIKKLKKRTGILDSIRIRRQFYICSILFVVGLMIYGNYNFNNPSVVELELTVDKQAGNMKSLRIAVVSDIHAGTLINKGILSRYVDQIMDQKADLILLVGDIIDYDLKPLVEERMDEEFNRLQAPYGVYMSTGNHEYIDVDETPDAKIKWLRTKSGMTLLQDSIVKVNDSFYVLGREDDRCATRMQIIDLVEGIDKDLPLIVLNHEPHRLYAEVIGGADIALYGHTHNGQLFPANILVSQLYELGYGYKKKDNMHAYVSSGLGLAGPQYRIGTQSEIVVLNVKFRKR